MSKITKVVENQNNQEVKVENSFILQQFCSGFLQTRGSQLGMFAKHRIQEEFLKMQIFLPIYSLIYAADQVISLTVRSKKRCHYKRGSFPGGYYFRGWFYFKTLGESYLILSGCGFSVEKHSVN